MHRAVRIAQTEVKRAHRRFTRVAEHGFHADKAGHGGRVRTHVRKQAELASRRHGQHHDARVDGAQGLVPQAAALHRARRHVLDDEIAHAGQPLEQFHGARLLGIERDAQFAVVDLVVHRGHFPRRTFQRLAITDDTARQAQVVGAQGMFDLDHLGAEFAQHGADPRRRPDPAEVQYTHARERPGDVAQITARQVFRRLFRRYGRRHPQQARCQVGRRLRTRCQNPERQPRHPDLLPGRAAVGQEFPFCEVLRLDHIEKIPDG